MFRFLWQNVVFYVFEKTMWYSMICDKNAVFQVSSMVLIHHKYNSKWGRKATNCFSASFSIIFAIIFEKWTDSNSHAQKHN